MAGVAPNAAASDAPFPPGARKPGRWAIVRPTRRRRESCGCPSLRARWGAHRARPTAETAPAAVAAPATCRGLLRLDPPFDLHRLVVRAPHPAVVLRDLAGGEGAAVAAHAFALHGVEDIGARVVVDVEVHGAVGAPVVIALLARLQLEAFLVQAFRLDGDAERLGAGIVTRMRAREGRGA